MAQIDELLSQARVFLDATPLLEENWTGISVVCANIARCLVQKGLQVDFCLEQSYLCRESVLEALDRSSGLVLARELATGRLAPSILPINRSELTIGLSSSVKRFHRAFDVECSWVHDISTLLQPEYHTANNIVWHMERITDDLESNDITACISQATLDDIVNYFGVAEDHLILAPNSVDWPWWFWVKERSEPREEPYLLVLGTQEPRKNLSLVFNMLSIFPDVLKRHRVMIVGQRGWMQEQLNFPSFIRSAMSQGLIAYTGFISDYEKFRLLRGADVTIFPSFFEGFGLPVIESLSVGTPCVASFSSSIPEVGGKCCLYFDPFSPTSLRDALNETIARNRKADNAFARASVEWVERYSWGSSVDAVLEALLPSVRHAWARK